MKLQQDKYIICLEGMVGAGKSTQLERLNSRFQPNSDLLPELNDITPMKELRDELRSTGRISNLQREDVIRIIRARAEIQQRFLKQSTKPLILMDRGLYTGMVFESGSLSMWEVEQISLASGVVIPDLCFILYCSVDKALQRIDERRMRLGKYLHRAFHETEDYLAMTRKRYLEIARARPAVLVETSGTVEQVENKIMETIYNAKIL